MSEHHLTGEVKHLAEEIASEAEQEVEGTAALLTAEQRPTLLDAMGGTLGILESAVPSVAFVIAYSAAGQTVKTSAIIAVALAVAAAIVRVARRSNPQFAITGVLGVGISAAIAVSTGEARNMFVVGLGANVVYAAVALGSIAFRRPLIGLIVGGFGEDDGWRHEPAKYRAFVLATYLWAGLFILRLVVQVPMYIADKPALLGTVKTAMGLPLFGVGIALSWLILRRAGAVPARDGSGPTD